MSLFYFSIYRGADQDHEKVKLSETNNNLLPSLYIDTARLILEVDSLIKNPIAEKLLPYILTIDHSGIEDIYTQQWYFNNNFELERIDYSWAGESFSGDGIYRFSKNRLLSKIDTSREESTNLTYTFYHYQLTNSGGIKYDNLIQVDSAYSQTIKETKIKILPKVDFESEEKRILKDISDHLVLINKLKNTSRTFKKKVVLNQIDTVKYPNYQYNETLTYKVDSLLFKELTKKIGE